MIENEKHGHREINSLSPLIMNKARKCVCIQVYVQESVKKRQSIWLKDNCKLSAWTSRLVITIYPKCSSNFPNTSLRRICNDKTELYPKRIQELKWQKRDVHYFAWGSLEYLIIAGINFLGSRFFVIIHDSTVSYASSMIRSGANLYCKMTDTNFQPTSCTTAG